MLVETVAVSVGSYIILEKVVDSVEPLRNFFRGQTMIQAAEMSVETLTGKIADEVSKGFRQVSKQSQVTQGSNPQRAEGPAA